jgi:hypothetical protein
MSFDVALRPMILTPRLRTLARQEPQRSTNPADQAMRAPDEKGPKGLFDALDVWSPLSRPGTRRREDTRR